MRLGLTRILNGMLLAAVATMGSVQAEEPTLSSEEQGRYLSELKRLYLTEDERKALLAHSNDLLKTYALSAGYQIGQRERKGLSYQLSVSAPGELLVREELRNEATGELRVSRQQVSVFGLDPFIRYECPQGGNSCVLLHPIDGKPWLTILRDHKGAAELAKALSFLSRNLQKG